MIAPSEAEIRMWQQEITAMKRRNASASDQELITFYGSSSVRLWEQMQQDLHPYQTLNLGFGGSSYFWCDYFFDEAFENIKVKHVILYAGDNDLGNGYDVTSILENVQSLLSKIERKYGAIPISLLSVKPSPERVYLREEMLELNEKLATLLPKTTRRGYFIDIYHPMLAKSGEVQPDLYEADQLHMSRKGYLIWKQVILDHLQALHS